MPFRVSRFVLVLLALLVACQQGFQPRRYSTSEALYRASVERFERRKWDDAIAGFEKLQTDLPARDPLLPRVLWYLATAQERRGDHLLAAQSYTRLVESFPDDTLGARAALEAARAYRRMWRRPDLDPTYGETALVTYNTFLSLYPSSPLAPTAQREIAELQNWFAEKNLGTGMHYFRRKGYDSAMIYFKDVIRMYPDAPAARTAGIRLVDVYRLVRYREEASEQCTELARKYPGDREVRQACAAAGVTAATAPAPASAPGSAATRTP